MIHRKFVLIATLPEKNAWSPPAMASLLKVWSVMMKWSVQMPL